MTPEAYYEKLDQLPKLHEPRAYTVHIHRRRKWVATRYVRATSEARARLAGLYWNNSLTSKRRGDTAAASLSEPHELGCVPANQGGFPCTRLR